MATGRLKGWAALAAVAAGVWALAGAALADVPPPPLGRGKGFWPDLALLTLTLAVIAAAWFAVRWFLRRGRAGDGSRRPPA